MKKIYIALIVVYAVIAVYLLVFSESGILRRRELANAIKETELAIENAKREIDALEKTIARLQTDTEYLKALAKSYGLTESDKEKIVIFMKKDIESNEARMYEQAAFVERNRAQRVVLIALVIVFSIGIFIAIKFGTRNGKPAPQNNNAKSKERDPHSTR